MILIGDKKEIIMILQKPQSGRYSVCCIGRKKHYRKNGTCKHTDSVLAAMKPEIAANTNVDGWGGNAELTRLDAAGGQSGVAQRSES